MLTVIPAVSGGPGFGVKAREARGAWEGGEEKEGTQTSPSRSECDVKTSIKVYNEVCCRDVRWPVTVLQTRSLTDPAQGLGLGTDPPGQEGRSQLGKERWAELMALPGSRAQALGEQAAENKSSPLQTEEKVLAANIYRVMKERTIGFRVEGGKPLETSASGRNKYFFPIDEATLLWKGNDKSLSQQRLEAQKKYQAWREKMSSH